MLDGVGLEVYIHIYIWGQRAYYCIKGGFYIGRRGY